MIIPFIIIAELRIVWQSPSDTFVRCMTSATPLYCVPHNTQPPHITGLSWESTQDYFPQPQ